MQENKEDCNASQTREERDTTDADCFLFSAPNLSVPDPAARNPDPYESAK